MLVQIYNYYRATIHLKSQSLANRNSCLVWILREQKLIESFYKQDVDNGMYKLIS